ncbi:44558_t:CDS:2, partial [Gigaspora margarita]
FTSSSTNFIYKSKYGYESTYIQSYSRYIKWDSSGGKSGFTFLRTQVKNLCTLQERLAELELKKEEMEKVSQVFKTVIIVLVIPPQLCDKTISNEEDCAFGLVFSTREE